MAWKVRGNPQHTKWAMLYKGTKAELALEAAICTLGIPYRTNFPCHIYLPKIDAFPDFLLPSLGLVIEVDGKEHFTDKGKAEDAQRTKKLQYYHGWTVVRCTNEEAETFPADTVDLLLSQAGFDLKVDRSKMGPSLVNLLPKVKGR